MQGHAVLVPGWGTAPDRMRGVAQALAERGVTPHVWAYEPTGSIDDLSRRLTATMSGRDDELHLVGHSLGGLIVASAALRHLHRQVATVTTINSPWRGTWLGFTAPGRLAASLRWRSEPLARLRTELTEHLAEADGPRWLVLGVTADLGTPFTTSTGVRDPSERLARRVVHAAGHSGALSSVRVHAAVADHVSAS